MDAITAMSTQQEHLVQYLLLALKPVVAVTAGLLIILLLKLVGKSLLTGATQQMTGMAPRSTLSAIF